jgi:hypothetical protein
MKTETMEMKDNGNVRQWKREKEYTFAAVFIKESHLISSHVLPTQNNIHPPAQRKRKHKNEVSVKYK